MRTTAIIPARYSSSRFPGKPLAPIAGKPMIQHVYERAAGCPELARVVVATDDERILTTVRGFGGQVVWTAPDHQSGTDRVSEAARSLGVAPQDVVINIQGDQPLFEPGWVRLLVAAFDEDDSLEMATLRCILGETGEANNPNCVKVVTDRTGYALYFSRLPIPYCREGDSDGYRYKHIGIYGFRADFLHRFTRLPQGPLEVREKLEQLRALEHGFRIRVVETPLASVEVDVPEDIPVAEAALAARLGSDT